MIIYACTMMIEQGDKGLQELWFTVSTNKTWKVMPYQDWRPAGGTWVASDLVGMGGCVCYGDDPKKTPIFRLFEFKPYGYEKYKVGKVGQGKGKFLEPLMPVGKKEFNWEITSIATTGLDRE
jgi:hypothetical protein